MISDYHGQRGKHRGHILGSSLPEQVSHLRPCILTTWPWRSVRLPSLIASFRISTLFCRSSAAETFVSLVDVVWFNGHGFLRSVNVGQPGGQWLTEACFTIFNDDEISVGPRLKGLNEVHDFPARRGGFGVVLPTESNFNSIQDFVFFSFSDFHVLT